MNIYGHKHAYKPVNSTNNNHDHKYYLFIQLLFMNTIINRHNQAVGQVHIYTV